MYACVCKGITEREVRAVGREGIVSPAALIEVLGLDDDASCGRCAANVELFVELAWEGASAVAPPMRRPAPRPAFA